MRDIAKRVTNLSPEKRLLLLRQLYKRREDISQTQIRLQKRDTDAFPLSFAQQRLWFLDQLEPGGIAYLMPTARRLHGVLDTVALEKSLDELIRRHEMLRTTFQVRARQPVQVIHPPAGFHLPLMDLCGVGEEERESEVRRLAGQEIHRPCDLAHGPLLRSYLLKLNSEEHVFLVTMHHIISDGWSMQVFERELAMLYRAFAAGQPSPLPPLPIQYADFAFWQRQWLHGEILEAQLAYWGKQLAGVTALKLPTDRPRPAVQSHRGAIHNFILSKELSLALIALSHQENVTLFMLVLAAFQTLLHRYTGQEDMVIGTDVANRNRAEVEGLIGFFINQLVLRSNLSHNPTFRELLQRVSRMALEAYTQQDLPFEKIVETLRPERSSQSAPLFQVKVLFHESSHEMPAPREAHTSSEVARSSLPLPDDTIKIDLILNLAQTPHGFHGSFTYSIDLFDAATVARMVRHFITLLESVCANPDIRLNGLEILTKHEKEQQLMHQKEHEIATFAKFKTIKPKPVSLQQEKLIQAEYLKANEPLPLVIRPDRAQLDLVDWAKNNLAFIETELFKHGALLFRDFGVSSATEFERFALAICPDLFGENGEHVPADAGSGNLYTPVFYAPEKKLLWHNENSFNYAWPMKIWFFCAKTADQGGETPIVDSRKIFQRIDPHIREQFMQKDIMYIRNYGKGLGLTWQTVFRTTEKAEVEEYCHKSLIEFEWKDGDGLRTRQIRSAVAKHPRTGELVWWNQATHWHPACLDEAVRDSLRSLFSQEDLPRNCYYGDGSPIEDPVMVAICEAYQEAEISFPWKVGDILMLDNMLTAHARNPFQGQRKIYVSMGGMITMKDL